VKTPRASTPQQVGARKQEVEPPSIELLGPPPVIDGEDPKAYAEMYQRIRDAFGAKDMIEEILLRTFADLTWEILRGFRLKAALLASSQKGGLGRLRDLVAPEFPGRKPRMSFDMWDEGEPAELVTEVKRAVAKAGFGDDAIMAQTLSNIFDHFEKIDAMMARAERRRGQVLRDLANYEEDRARRLAEAAKTIEADFKDEGRAV